MKSKIKKSKKQPMWFMYYDHGRGAYDFLGFGRTPKEARTRLRKWHRYMETGDKEALRGWILP